MYQFRILDKQYTMPSEVHELTLGQFMDLRTEKTPDGFLKILLGEVPTVNIKNADDIQKLNLAITNIFKLSDQLAKELSECLKSKILIAQPAEVNLNGLSINIKANFIDQLNFWGYTNTKQIILERVQFGRDEKFDATDYIPSILSHNLYELVTKQPYDRTKANDFETIVRDMSFIEATQLSNFFLLQQKKLFTSKSGSWLVALNVWAATVKAKFIKQPTYTDKSIDELLTQTKNGK